MKTCRGVELALCVLLAACNTLPAVDDGKKLIAEGRTEEGLAKLQQATREIGRAHV